MISVVINISCYQYQLLSISVVINISCYHRNLDKLHQFSDQSHIPYKLKQKFCLLNSAPVKLLSMCVCFLQFVIWFISRYLKDHRTTCCFCFSCYAMERQWPLQVTLGLLWLWVSTTLSKMFVGVCILGVENNSTFPAHYLWLMHLE